MAECIAGSVHHASYLCTVFPTSVIFEHFPSAMAYSKAYYLMNTHLNRTV